MKVRIIERLEALAEQLDQGEITLRDFASQLPGHATALENLKYSQIKEAQLAAVELSQMAEMQETGADVDVYAAVEWLRGWLAGVQRAS